MSNTVRRQMRKRRALLVMLLIGSAAGLLSWPHLSGYLAGLRALQKAQMVLPSDQQPLPKEISADPAFRGMNPLSSYGRYAPPISPAAPPEAAISQDIIAANLLWLNDRMSPPAQLQAPVPVPLATETRPKAQDHAELPKLNILLIGNDQFELDKGRGDVLLVMNVDPNKKRLTFISIPRDTRTFFSGHGIYKINAGYQFGGAELQASAIERFLGIPMDYVFEVSRTGFQKAIDAVGGIDVRAPFPFQIDGVRFSGDKQHVNGSEALAYVRMRYQDPQGDLGRNERQQEIVRELLQSLPRRSAAELNSVLVGTEGHVRSNLSMQGTLKLVIAYKAALSEYRVIKVRGRNRMIGGAAFYVVTDQERRRLHQALR